MKYTTRADFPTQLPAVRTEYCWHCHQPSLRLRGRQRRLYLCTSCGKTSGRALIFDPAMQMRFDESNRLVHESSGVFISRDDGKLLLFQRTKFPFLLTIPAGHIDRGEEPLAAAYRETEEEVGVRPATLKELYSGQIVRDSCKGGADIHNWHAYHWRVDPGKPLAIVLDEEGAGWDWYEVSDLNSKNTAKAVLWLLKNIDRKLLS